MTQGKQWIHFDAHFPLGLGHELRERFGPAGELLFVQFLCACKRSFPQGQISYRNEEELRILLGADFDFIDKVGDKWGLGEFWKWCGRSSKTRTTTRKGRTTVRATRWEAWEDEKRLKNAERMRRSRADSVRARARLRGEVGGMRGEVGGVRGEGERGFVVERPAPGAAEKLLAQLDEVKNQQPADRRNGTDP